MQRERSGQPERFFWRVSPKKKTIRLMTDGCFVLDPMLSCTYSLLTTGYNNFTNSM